jgi:hypothetical protein
MRLKELDKFITPLRRVNLRQALKEAAMQHRQDALDLQQEQQYAGKEATGQEITPAYARLTVQIKKAKGQPADRVTLKDTGAFYRQQYTAFQNDHFEIKSRNGKTPKLLEKYGENIFGLTAGNKARLAGWIKPDMQRIYRSKLLKG